MKKLKLFKLTKTVTFEYQIEAKTRPAAKLVDLNNIIPTSTVVKKEKWVEVKETV